VSERPAERLETATLDDCHELFNEVAILPAKSGVLSKNLDRLVRRHDHLVRTCARHGVVQINDIHDLRDQRDVIAAQPIWIARAVTSLVVMPNDRADGMQ